jgi:hypothetical protein
MRRFASLVGRPRPWITQRILLRDSLPKRISRGRRYLLHHVNVTQVYRVPRAGWGRPSCCRPRDPARHRFAIGRPRHFYRPKDAVVTHCMQMRIIQEDPWPLVQPVGPHLTEEADLFRTADARARYGQRLALMREYSVKEVSSPGWVTWMTYTVRQSWEISGAPKISVACCIKLVKSTGVPNAPVGEGR